jgi:hypothetical protein
MSDTAEIPVESRGNHIPGQVRRAAARADELLKAQQEFQQEKSGDPAPVTPTPETPADEAPQDEVNAPAEPRDRSSSEESTGAPPSGPTGTDNFEQRYKTLQGKYDAEVPRLQRELAQLRQALGQMQGLLQQQQAAPPPPPQQQISGETPAEIVEEYGEDFARVMRRLARLEVSPEVQAEINTLRQQMAQLQGGQQQTEGQMARSHLEAGLSSDPEIGAHWRQLNNDQNFIAWLGDIDPFAGVPRQELLHDAARRTDVGRTAQFFRAYLREHTAPQAYAGPPQTPALSNGQDAGRPTLESLASPGRARAPVRQGGASEKRIWSGADIEKFYQDVLRGRYKGREAEQLRIEADIVSATAENRYAPR